MEYIKNLLKLVKNQNLYPDIKIIRSAAAPKIKIDGREILSFCSNNYLGLANHPKVKEKAIEAIDKYGTSCGGSRLISGNLFLHEELEREIAQFKKMESAVVFMSGYMANTGIIPALMDTVEFMGLPTLKQENSIVISDQLNHASIVDGCRLSKAPRFIYKHKDMKELEKILKKNKSKRKLIVTDGIFSMDGDISPLPQIVELAQKYKAMVMVDDAHATGILGENGRGTPEHYRLEGKIDIVMGTFSKALGGVGGFIAGSKELVEFLKIRARSYIFSSALPPGTAAGLIAAIGVIKNDPNLREKLWKNINRMRSGLKNLGFNILHSETQIIPVFIGEEKKAIQFSMLLFEKGIFIPCVRWPAVPKGESRLRCTVMSTHTEEEIDQCLRAFKSLK